VFTLFVLEQQTTVAVGNACFIDPFLHKILFHAHVLYEHFCKLAFRQNLNFFYFKYFCFIANSLFIYDNESVNFHQKPCVRISSFGRVWK